MHATVIQCNYSELHPEDWLDQMKKKMTRAEQRRELDALLLKHSQKIEAKPFPPKATNTSSNL